MGIKTKKVSYNAQRQTPCYYCYCFSATDRPVLKGQKSSLQTAIHQTQSDGSSDGSSSTSNEGTEIISTGAQKRFCNRQEPPPKGVKCREFNRINGEAPKSFAQRGRYNRKNDLDLGY